MAPGTTSTDIVVQQPSSLTPARSTPASFAVLMLGVFALTLFSSATLLFMVQPMIGKLILPLLGGTPEVWNTCMVFFQALLLAGYGYAHASTTWLAPRRQAWVHLFVMLIPFLFLPIAVDKEWIRGGEANPILSVLLLLFFSVGVPFFVVSASAPLLQKWFSSTDHPAARDPYFLYGASNLGSMLALFGYPVAIEPLLRLGAQTYSWAFGYGILVALTAACAWLLWKAAPAPVGQASSLSDDRQAGSLPHGPTGTDAIKTERGKPAARVRKRSQQVRATPPAATALAESNGEVEISSTLDGSVTFGRRLRWVMLAAVPSSLMLGVTTYITTDIAAIPLLWVLPLTLYLLSFIIVFAKIPQMVQSAIVFALAIITLVIGFAGMHELIDDQANAVQTLAWVIWLGLLGASFIILFLRDRLLIHKAMVLALPLLILLLIFTMLSEIKPAILYGIALHLATLFATAMVCHGELANNRPPTRYLTEFYLWMSFGGVLGGLFNALVAPLVFNSLAEYQVAMVMACLLLPPLTNDKPGVLGKRIDLGLCGVFLAVGVFLILARVFDPRKYYRLEMEPLYAGPWFGLANWGWLAGGLVLGLALGSYLVWRNRGERQTRLLDLLLPLTLGVLVVGLIWGTYANLVDNRLSGFADRFNIEKGRLRLMVTFGLPAVLCYTFVERSVRFGLGVGAILLASAFCGLFNDETMLQKRSFFGVLSVQNDGIYHRLVHGTTLHGKQFVAGRTRELKDGCLKTQELTLPLLALPDQGSGLAMVLYGTAAQEWGPRQKLLEQPLTYYHHTGPIGQIMDAYNSDPNELPNIAVIGLGTGTMSCYARKGQSFTFYDIDPLVRDIAQNWDYFTYWSDAVDRGANLNLLINDARLALERQVAEEPDRPEAEKYKVMVIDAFSSDAIPIHLITREALQLYLKMLRQDGMVAFHVSNRYLDLRPVLARLAEAEGLVGYTESDTTGDYAGKTSSTWVVLARDEKTLERLVTADRWQEACKDLIGTRDGKPLGLVPLLLACPDASGKLALRAGDIAFLTSQHQTENNKQSRAVKAPWQRLRTSPHVGLWTDDFSNVLGIFQKWQKDDEDAD